MQVLERKPKDRFSILLSMRQVYGEGEWKVKKHGTDGKRRVWPKLHLAVDTSTHEIIAAELSLSTVRDAEVQSNLLKQTRRKILDISGDGAYDTRDATQQSVLDEPWLFSFQERGAFWERGHPRNLAVTCQKLLVRTSIGKSAMATTSARYLKRRCIESNSCLAEG
ncbi:hypothetical protein FORC14_1189 [Vibrio parahaemolyticus]|nr:hypothetical protein FORC14_1189 [Vibrio parahaemolyticus]